ncbi:DNA polymerase I [Candidatus Dojkabacteria bacterium]|uniref:DNA polymerase I n=1 Tax=Candidatus Dojkabacteria bacterium TaxID=2099670 RepID=A0A955LA38_9BACT|nr:DNA polymerase I [Candidatus Dojkabacteria bacterium]
MERKKLVIIDSFALIFRAYYAYPPTLSTKDGMITNAIYGYATLLIDVINKFKPDYLIAVFDSDKPTIRSTEFATYKANRKETDQDLLLQIPKVIELVETFNIPMLKVDGYEADDIIATLCETYKKRGIDQIVVTGDQDLFQLVDDDTSVYLAGKSFSQSKLYNADDVFEKLGVKPTQIPDFKGLSGDPSDNIPGVAGIGKKSAEQLLTEYGSIDEVYSHIEELKPAWKNKLQEGYEIAIKSRELATVVPDVPINFAIESAEFDTFPLDDVLELCSQLEFKSITVKIKKLAESLGINTEEKSAAKQSLGLFEQLEESDVSVTFKNYSEEIHRKDENLFIFSKVNNIEKAPIDYQLDEIIVKLGEDLYSVKQPKIKDFIKGILKNSNKIIGVNIKELLHSLINLGIDAKEVFKISFEDLGYATQIVSEGTATYSIEDVLSFTDSGYSSTPEAILEKLPNAYEYIKEVFVKDKKLYEVYELEKEVLSTVIEMEQEGILFDHDKIEEFKQKLDKEIDKLTKKIYEYAGHEFNINSPKQVGEVLFEEMGLPVDKKTKSGSYSTNEKSLSKIKEVDPIVEAILNFRELDKLRSTYVTPLPGFVSNDGKIHAVFDQMGAVSGRFSSRNPNMQNIPANDGVGVNIRDAFIAEKDSIFVAFDYSQQELRILSALADEQIMIDSFNKGEDIHALTASQLFGKDVKDVTKSERTAGKTINFSIVYGVSGFGLSENLKIGRKEAQDLIDTYYSKYKKIAEYFDNKRKEIHIKMYGETILGRRRKNTMTKSKQWFIKNAVERELLNFAIQGSAADLMKLAMNKFEQRLSKYPAKLILQIHDEFLFEFNKPEDKKLLNEFIVDVKDIMENVYDIGVDYKVDVKSGKIWGKME